MEGERPCPITLANSLRLRAKREIDRVFKKGKYLRLGMLQAKFLVSDAPHSRFMISVRKSVGNAPQRNRVKRVVREAIRLNRESLKIPYDVCLFLTNRPKHRVRLSIVEEEIQKLFANLNKAARPGDL